MRYILYILFFSVIGYSQFKVTHYNSENGLPHDLCYQIIQDKQGYIWLGTDNGLVKFNGREFRNFNKNEGLTYSFVIDVFEHNEKKYIATWGGGLFELKNNIFKNIGTKENRFSKQQQILVTNDNKIISVENKTRLNIIDRNKNSIQLLSLVNYSGKFNWVDANYVTKIDLLKSYPSTNFQISKIEDNTYVFSDRFLPQFKGVYQIKKSPVEVFNFLNKFSVIDLFKKGKNFVAVTPKSIISFTDNKIISKSDIPFADKTIVHYTENNRYKIYVLQNEQTNHNELYIIDIYKNKKRLYDNKTIKSPVSDILISSDNTIWVSTYGNGLLLFQEDILKVNKNSLSGISFFEYLELPNYNFFLSTNDIFITDKNYKFKKKIPYINASKFKSVQNDTILITAKSNVIVSNAYGYTFKPDLRETFKYINKKTISYGDNVLNYYLYNKKHKVDFKLTKEEYNFFKINKVLPYKNKLYVITNYGIFILNKNFILEKRITQRNGLISNDILNAFVWNNKLYLLLYQSIVIGDGVNFEKHFYDNNLNNFFNDFTVTKNGEVWITSQKGLVLFKNKEFHLFTTQEGLSSSFYTKIYENKNKELVALGKNGLDVFDTEFEPKLKPIKIIITQNGKEISKNQKIQFQPKDASIVGVEIINFINSKYKIEYQINEQSWKPLNGKNIDFSNYSSGKYTLKIRSKFYFSDWTTTPTYSIEKIPVWYLRWYFYIPLILVGILVIGIIIFLRIKNLNKRNELLQNLLNSNEKLQFQLNEMRHNIAQDFHDELGNKLAGISVLSDKLLHDEKLKTNENYPLVERIYSDSLDLFNGIRDFIWAIDSKNGTLEELIFALTDFGENLYEHSSMKFVVNNKIENPNFLLPNFWNRQLLLLFKEVMTNAFKHSQATLVDLIFKMENNILIIECKDNGIGFNPKKLSRQNGLLNLQKRVNKLKSELVITSNSGTSIIFKGRIN